MSTHTRVIKNSGYLYFRLGITLFVSLWTTRIILEALGIDNFGIYNIVGGVISLLGFVNATLASATQRFMNFAEGENNLTKKRAIFNNSLILHFFLGIFLIILFIVVGAICFNGLLKIPPERLYAAKWVYIFMILSTVLSVINVPYEAAINAHEDMMFYAFIGIIEVFMKLIIAFVIQTTDWDRLILYGILMALVPCVTLTIMKLYCHKKYKECIVKPKKYFDKGIIRELGSFAGWNFTNSASGVATQYGLNIVINHFFGVTLNAAQGIANQVSGVLVNISSNALKVLNPIIVKSESMHQRERMLYVSLLGCRVTFFIFSLISIPLISEMPLVLNLWLTDVPHWAIIFCQLQLIRIATEMLTYSLNSSIMAQGDIKMYNIFKSIINILPLIIIIIAFYYNAQPYWMYIIWTVVWSGIGGLANLFFAHKNIGLKYSQYLKSVLYPALIAVGIPCILLVICRITFNSEIINFISLIGVEIILVVLSWRFLLLKKERDEISKIIHKL